MFTASKRFSISLKTAGLFLAQLEMARDACRSMGSGNQGLSCTGTLCTAFGSWKGVPVLSLPEVRSNISFLGHKDQQ